MNLLIFIIIIIGAVSLGWYAWRKICSKSFSDRKSVV